MNYGAVVLKATFRFNAGAGKFGAAYAQVFYLKSTFASKAYVFLDLKAYLAPPSIRS